MSLTDTVVRHARCTGKDYTLNDLDGLALFVASNGAKSWHFRFSWVQQRARISLGTYPEISLKEARERRDQARALLAKGIDPRVHRKEAQRAVIAAAGNTFGVVYERWLEHRKPTLEEGRQTTLAQIPRIFAKDVLPTLNALTIYEITRAHLLAVIGRIEARQSLSVAEKVRTWLRQLFEYAAVVIPGLEVNPAASLDVVAAPLPPVQHNPFLRILELPGFLRALRNLPGQLQTQLAVRLLLLTGVRTGELRLATPDQFNLDRGLWIIPPNVVKQLKLQMRRKRQRPETIPPYIVPLSIQAMEIVRPLLAQWKPAQHFLFPSVKCLKSRISENTVNQALKRLGYEDLLTGHGIRGTISTALNEIGYPTKWVDAQLSHADPDRISGSYNHAEYVEQRRVMMQDWADRLDLLEQNRIDAASLHLTIHLEGVSAVTGERAAGERDSKTHSSMLLVTQPGSGVSTVPASVHRLSAVSLPSYAKQEISGIHRERMRLLDVFQSPNNLRVVEFAKLAGKSRRWISYEIRAGKLLALSIGNRGLRVPDWHLDPLKHNLIQTVLKQANGVDPWRLYQTLSQPHNALGGHAPIESVTSRTFSKVVSTMQSALNASEEGINALKGSTQIEEKTPFRSEQSRRDLALRAYGSMSAGE